MKLYATITSERATKGQGGKWLNISIDGHNKKTLWKIQVRDYDAFYEIRLYNQITGKQLEDEVILSSKDIQKEVKKETGETKCNDITCINCNNTMEGLCDNCKQKSKVKKEKGEIFPRSRQFKNWPTNGA